MRKTGRRLISLALAVTMVTGLIGSGPLVETAQAASSGIIINWKGLTNTSIKVIRGTTVTVTTKNAENTALKDINGRDALNISREGLPNQKQTDYFDLKANSTNEIKMKPLLANELGDSNLEANVANGNYTVATNFISYQNVADTKMDKFPFSGTFTLIEPEKINWIPVQTTSTMTLKYLGNSQFEMIGVENPDTAGVFYNWNNLSVIKERCVVGTETTSEVWRLKINTYNADGQPPIPREFDFVPGYRIDPTLGASGEVITSGEYNIPPDSEFTITLNNVVSNQLLLGVIDPKVALQRVVDDASIPGPTNPYVKLTEPDMFTYLTKEMTLATKTSEGYQDIVIEWVNWAPDDPTADNKKAITFDRVVGGSTKAKVTQQQDDVKGKIEVIAYFLQSDINNAKDVGEITLGESGGERTDKVFAARSFLNVTVHGKGIPPVITQYSQTVGASGPTYFPEGTPLPTETFVMDAYDNSVRGYADTKLPKRYSILVDTGRQQGQAKKMIVEAEGDQAALTTTVTVGSKPAADYTFGGDISNSGNDQYIWVNFTAMKKSELDLNLKFRFFVDGPSGSIVEYEPAMRTMRLRVEDSSPNPIAKLDDFKITNNNKPIEGFVFSPDTANYTQETGNPILVPFEIESVKVLPVPFQWSRKIMGLTVEYYDDGWHDDNTTPPKFCPDYRKENNWVPDGAWSDMNSVGDSPSITASSIFSNTRELNLEVGVPVRVTIQVRAENPANVQKYVFEIMRNNPSTDSSLSKLQILGRDGVDYMKDFDPEVMEYNVSVPYRVDEVQPDAETTFPKAKATQMDQNFLGRMMGNAQWIEVGYDEVNPVTATIRIKVLSEYDVAAQGKPGLDDFSRIYTVHVKRDKPASIATLSAMLVTDKDDKNLPYTPAFHKVMTNEDYYQLVIPYSTNKVRFNVTPDDANAKMELIHNNKVLQKLAAKTPSKSFEVDYMQSATDYYEMTVLVTAENGVDTVSYPVHVMRAEPSDDASLTALTVADQNNTKVDLSPAFGTDITTYNATVPYESEKVSVTATLGYAGATLTVNGKNTASGAASAMITLKYPGTTTIKVSVLAENGKTSKTYTIKIKRDKPSSDARLKSLAIQGIEETYKPIFLPDTLDYTATVAVGQAGVIITAIPNHKFATLKIDGKTVKNGDPSELIELMKVKQKIEIIVTAQDGKTTRTYTITFTDMNKIELTDNANLESLVVKPGVMAPKFTPSATLYDVAVKEDVSSVQIIPKPDDELAKIQVFFGSKEIGDWDGNYAQTIVDGANEFLVTVTSPSGKVTKDYTVIVHRNEEGMLQTLTPITPDDINFDQTGDIVMVDITKYTRVSAEVFNLLKTDYPTKTIVFEGNDYSLEFKASDIDTIVPHTDIFDFALSFTSPEKGDILDITERYRENDAARMVFLYFDHHGALPAPATFTVSLGHMYNSETLFWNYYNAPYDRIDYYGNVKTNTKGTFAVKIDHLSTYIVSDQRLYGSENKAGANALTQDALTASAGDLSAETSAKKINPGTGAEAQENESAGLTEKTGTTEQKRLAEDMP